MRARRRTLAEIVEFLLEHYGSMMEVEHRSRVSRTTLYRILNHEGGYNKRVQAKLKKLLIETREAECKILN
jgi:hypothetical protein